jgi:hypothetical protein
MIVVRLAVRMTFREKIRLGWGKINRMVVFSLSDCTRDNLVRSKDVARGAVVYRQMWNYVPLYIY